MCGGEGEMLKKGRGRFEGEDDSGTSVEPLFQERDGMV
jgi:hypothetical protein